MVQVPRSFHAIFDAQAAASPDAPAFAAALSQPPVVQTYASLVERSKVLAAGLSKIVAGLPEQVSRDGVKLLGVHLSRMHSDFLPLLVAASRCGLPFVLLSCDLPDPKREEHRNIFILEKLQPLIVVGEGEFCTQSTETIGMPRETVPIALLASLGAESLMPRDAIVVGPEDDLCVLFTGGTQRMKVVRGTHGMLLHERVAYPKMVSLGGPQPRVLGNASAFWPAATLGQLSVSLAYGACFVVTDISNPMELKRVVVAEQVDVIGLVPDQLALLSQEPANELPWVRLVIAWAEKLPLHVARRWAGHPRAQLRELLIATEYWLALCAEPLNRNLAVARPVHAACAIALKLQENDEELSDRKQSEQAREGEVGELCLAGPMVTPGYIDVDGLSKRPPFVDVNGTSYFKTGDLVKVYADGFIFLGRSDMLTKERGQWVDMVSVESQLQALPFVLEAKIIPDPWSPSEFHAFVVVKRAADDMSAHDNLVFSETMPPPHIALQKMKALLPQRVSLHLVPKLPRHVATSKVDVQELRSAIALSTIESWPIVQSHAPMCPQRHAELALRLQAKSQSHIRWTMAFMAAGVGGWCLYRSTSGRTSWWQSLVSAPLGLFTIAYMHLTVIYASEHAPKTMARVQEVGP